MQTEEIAFLQIEPTTRCNFSCGFCAGRHMVQKDMALETFERIVRALPQVRHIEMQGEGEPFLHPGVFRFVAMAKDVLPGVKISTITNGSFLSSKTIQHILDCQLEKLLISIESPEDMHVAAKN